MASAKPITRFQNAGSNPGNTVGLATVIPASENASLQSKKNYLGALQMNLNEVLDEALKEYDFVFNHHNGEAEFQNNTNTNVDSSKKKPYPNKL